MLYPRKKKNLKKDHQVYSLTFLWRRTHTEDKNAAGVSVEQAWEKGALASTSLFVTPVIGGVCPGAKEKSKLCDSSCCDASAGREPHGCASSHAPHLSGGRSSRSLRSLPRPPTQTSPFFLGVAFRALYMRPKSPGPPERTKAHGCRGNAEQQRLTTSRWRTARCGRPAHRCYFLSKHKEGETKN